MAEALRKVKKHLGREAVIVSTRTVRQGGFLGFGGTRRTEITAARRMSDLPKLLRAGSIPIRSGGIERADGAATTMTATLATQTADVQTSILSEVGTLKSLVVDLMHETKRSRGPEVPEPLFDTYLKLVQNEVAEELAQALVARVRDELAGDLLKDADAVRRRLAVAVESMLPTAGPIKIDQGKGPALIALVGPTGVGKTTTVAKLAANFRLREKRRVGLITIDTYRIGAVEQLRTYAQIIDVPLEVVMTPQQLSQSVARMSDQDIVLIDTAGRGQRDTVKLNELKAFFAAVRPNEVHLVLSGAGREAVLSETVERFAGIGIDRVIFTKLDEAVGFGVVLSCLKKANAALSYVTTGQDVPDDIEVGQGRKLANLIVGNATETAGV